ncbi:type III-A CRISPR-associated RAMP protein Csm5 [Thermococcus sp.]
MMLKVLSPLHIGKGDELTPLDIYPAENTVHILNVEKLITELTDLGVSFGEIMHLLKNPPENAYIWKGYIDELRLSVSDYTLYTLRLHGEPGRRSMRIKEFIKLNGKPYIPGSSLKGAIRTAVFYKVLKECGDATTAMNAVSGVDSRTGRELGYSDSLIDYYINTVSRERRINEKRADDRLEAMVFGMERDGRFGVRYEPKRDPMRGLIIRDSGPIGKKHLAVYRVDVVGNPQPIPIWVEAVEPDAKTEIEIAIDKDILRMNENHFNGLLWECLKDRGEPWESFEGFIWEAVEEFYRAVIKAEKRDFPKFGRYSGTVKTFYSSLDGYSGHLLRLGWGSGWLAMTIGILLRESRRWESVRKKLNLGRNPHGRGFSRDFPKTRRLADGMPMGWVVAQ